MRRLPAILALCAGQLAAWPAGYGYYRSITIDHTKVPSTQTNIPIVITGTLATAHIQHTTTCCGTGITVPADWIFVDSDQTTQLQWDVESYNAGTGAFVVWVKVPSASSSVDTVIYMLYGNSSVSTYQATYTSTYDSNFKGVWHMSDVANFVDSTGNVSACTPTNSPTNGATTKIDGAMNLVAASSQYEDCGSPAATQITNNFTMSCWFWSDRTTAQSGFMHQYRAATFHGMALLLNSSASSVINFQATDGTHSDVAQYNNNINNSAWHRVTATFATKAVHVFLDGSDLGLTTLTNVSAISYGSEPFRFGANAALNTFYSGNMDQCTISNVVRSNDWETTSYNNQNNPGTFSTLGAETPLTTFRFPQAIIW